MSEINKRMETEIEILQYSACNTRWSVDFTAMSFTCMLSPNCPSVGQDTFRLIQRSHHVYIINEQSRLLLCNKKFKVYFRIIALYNCFLLGQNAIHWAPSHLQWKNLPVWITLSKWCSNSPSSPFHVQPSFLCVQKTESWQMERFRPLFGKTSKLFLLHVGQWVLIRWLHVWQKLVPQHVAWYGSRRIRRHIGQSVWKALRGESTNLQS